MSKTIQEQIEVMQHYADGGKIVGPGGVTAIPNLLFDWKTSNYNIHIEPLLINGIEIPHPETDKPTEGTRFFRPSLTNSLEFYKDSVWDSHKFNNLLLKRGLVHLTKEAAIAHSKALLSFTTKDN